MARQAKSVYRQEFLQRTREARDTTGLSQGDFAKLLGLNKDIYAKYENRSLLPHDLTPTFVAVTGASYTWLFTGIGKPPVQRNIADLEASS